jgi:hypothetical protein
MKKLLICLVALHLALAGCSKREAGQIAGILVMVPAVLVCAPFVSTKASLTEAFPDAPQTQALAKAAAAGDLGKMDGLVAHGADVNARGAGGATVIGWALYKQNLDGFRHLLELGADPNTTWDAATLPDHLYIGCSVMHASRGAFLRAALAAGGDPNLECGGKRLIESRSLNTDLDELALLESHGLTYDFMTADGEPFLCEAAGFKGYKLVYHMLNTGLDPWVKDAKGTTLYDRMQPVIRYIGPRGSTWLIEDQKVWFWRCVQFMEEHGAVFTMTPEAEEARELALEGTSARRVRRWLQESGREATRETNSTAP